MNKHWLEKCGLCDNQTVNVSLVKSGVANLFIKFLVIVYYYDLNSVTLT